MELTEEEQKNWNKFGNTSKKISKSLRGKRTGIEDQENKIVEMIRLGSSNPEIKKEHLISDRRITRLKKKFDLYGK